MKKTFRLLAIAAVSMMVAVACNNAPEENTDTIPVDTTPIDTLVEDTTPVIDTPAVEEPKTTVKTTKKPAKKQEPVKTTSAKEQNLDNTGNQSGSLSATNKNTKKSNNGTNAASQNLNNSGNTGAGSLSLKKN